MKKINILNWFLILGMIVGDIYLIIHDLGINKTDRLATYLVLIPILAVPWLFKKILHYEMTEDLKLVYYIFIFLAQFLGSGVNLYNKTVWFDKFTHGLSGILSCFVALILLVQFKKDPTKHLLFHFTYILGIVFLIAGGWECIEFAIDTFTGSDVQHVATTGVTDTMGDILSALLGSIIFFLDYFYEIKKSKKGIIYSFLHSLHKNN